MDDDTLETIKPVELTFVSTMSREATLQGLMAVFLDGALAREYVQRVGRYIDKAATFTAHANAVADPVRLNLLPYLISMRPDGTLQKLELLQGNIALLVSPSKVEIKADMTLAGHVWAVDAEDAARQARLHYVAMVLKPKDAPVKP